MDHQQKKPDKRVIPGNAVAVQGDLPFRGLTKFGNAFLNKFEASQLPSPVLEHMTIVDTPGILSGEKQRLQRGYDFTEVAQWFAERSDLILLLFDAHKLDVSDEFKRTIEVLKNDSDKIRCILNKADQIDRQRLMKVYGALMWSMGKVLQTPEVLRVYVGSFWKEPLRTEQNKKLFEKEESDLMADLKSLPRNSAVRKINELVKRIRLVKVHAWIIGELKSQMPAMMGKEKKQKELIDSLEKVFQKVHKTSGLPPGDFPDINELKEKLREDNFANFPKLKLKMLEELDTLMQVEFPKLMEFIPRNTGSFTDKEQALFSAPIANKRENLPVATVVDHSPVEASSCAPAPAPTPSANNPFAKTNPFAKKKTLTWKIASEKERFDQTFYSLNPENGLVSGESAVECFTLSELPFEPDLAKIWELADINADGQLDADEFAVAMYLIEERVDGKEIPDSLPPDLVPPKYR